MPFSDLAYVRTEDYLLSRIRRLQTQSASSSSAVTARQSSSAPPAPRVATALAAASNGYTFSYYEVSGTHGYNIYRNTANDPDTAVKIDFVPTSTDSFTRNRYSDIGFEFEQSSETRRTYTDNPGVTSYYWVAAVNESGNEGVKLAMQGASVPSPGVGTGIQSLGGLTGATQTFATGTAGTNFAITSAGSAHTFDLPDASATARGVVTTAAQTVTGMKKFAAGLKVNDAIATADADTTPTVGGGNLFTVANTGATSITAFDDGAEGQVIMLIFSDANTTIVASASIKLIGGLNFVSTADDTMMLVRKGSAWYEFSRSVNA